MALKHPVSACRRIAAQSPSAASIAAGKTRAAGAKQRGPARRDHDEEADPARCGHPCAPCRLCVGARMAESNGSRGRRAETRLQSYNRMLKRRHESRHSGTDTTAVGTPQRFGRQVWAEVDRSRYRCSRLRTAGWIAWKIRSQRPASPVLADHSTLSSSRRVDDRLLPGSNATHIGTLLRSQQGSGTSPGPESGNPPPLT